MASEWTPYSLSELVQIKHGYAFSGEYFRDDPPGDILLTPGNFAIGGGFKDAKMKYYHGPVPQEYVLHEGDLLVSMTDLSKGGDTLGYPALVPTSATTARYLHNQRLGLAQIMLGAPLEKRFLYYLLCTEPYRNEVLASATGSSVRHTSPNRIRAFQFLLPPPDEQRAIADILGSLDDKIELNRQMNATLEAMARALFQSWFVDFDPVRAKAAGESPVGMDAETAALFPDSFEDNSALIVPDGWKIESLLESAEYINGAAYRDFDFSADGSGLPIIKIAELKNGITEQTKFTNKEIASKFKITSGDILFSWSGNPETSIDTFIWALGDAWLNQHIFKVLPFKPIERSFIYLLLRYLKPEFTRIASNKQTTGLGHVTRQDMEKILTALPPEKVLKAFSQLTEPILALMFSNELQIQTLRTKKDSLLPKLINGELRVESVTNA